MDASVREAHTTVNGRERRTGVDGWEGWDGCDELSLFTKSSHLFDCKRFSGQLASSAKGIPARLYRLRGMHQPV